MAPLYKGRFCARAAAGAADLAAAQSLRARSFLLGSPRDRDPFDDISTHILIEDLTDGTLVCCYRLLELDGASLCRSYAAQYYDLEALARFQGRMLELGRFCIAPERKDPDILRIAWAVMTDLVDRQRITFLFGCSSFAGINPEVYLDAFALLHDRHLAPERWLPCVKAPDVFRFATRMGRVSDLRKALLEMPPLLRSYLLMGGRVSDHAVVDHQMNTLHVFTGVETGAIPESRKRLLRALV
ncbi:GNAT family N-acetyltransferase [Sulfitobacter sp. F26204]|uniref:GNAT family N-acetyltransferase n=1 Tax=Sulfitobacter sp. F26204 TaxID=2996014 RepID=UPI003A4C5C09